MPTMTSTSGQRNMSEIWPTFSLFKARLPSRSPIAFEPSYRHRKRVRSGKIEAEEQASAADVSTLSFELALDERDAAAAASALANIPREGYTDANSFPFPRAWFEGLLAELRGDAPATQ